MRRAIAQLAQGKARVLEIGPGSSPFEAANEFVDWCDWPELKGRGPVHAIDINEQQLPFADKSFDFVYCRHTLEDIYNPMRLLREMSRVGRSGYLETPSPMTEFTRHVQGPRLPFRGFAHHRYLFWVQRDERGEILHILPKMPLIEHITFGNEAKLAEMLQTGPLYWNTYHLWDEQTPLRYHLWRHGQDFLLIENYRDVINSAIRSAIDHCDAFATRLGVSSSTP